MPRFSYPPIVNNTFATLTNGSLIILPLFLLISELSTKAPIVVANVTKSISSHDTVQTFSEAIVLSAQEINITSGATAIHLFGPRPYIDPMYCMLFLLNGIIVAFFFWDFSYKKPFTKKTLWGLRIALVLLVIFITCNIFRYEWFDGEVKRMTSDQYSYNRPSVLASAELWIMLALMRIVRIFHKGLKLQREMNLIV
jgi:hypothetical protein